MTEKQLCMNCKHLAHDGMAGIWCSVHGNNENYDCPKFEYNYGILTKEEAINNLKRLYYENNRLKQRITTQSVDREQLVKRINEVKKENKQLKKKNQFWKEVFEKEFDENEQLKHDNKMLLMKISEVYTKYCLLNEFSEDTNPNDAVKRILFELMQITKEYR